MGAAETPVLLSPDEVVGAFFAPAATDMVSEMAAEYRGQRARIEAVAAWVKSPDVASVMHHFLNGNADESRGRMSMAASAEQLFRVDGAIANLNAVSWSKALALTDVYDAMPQDRRNQWNEQIRNPEGQRKDRQRVTRERQDHPERFDPKGEYLNPNDAWHLPPLPDFDEETVRATLQDLLASRAKFLAERVDGIFRALSGEHVTNSPAAFGKRMIIARLINGWGSTCHERVGYINDLRCVIAKFMGRDEPHWRASSSIVEFARTARRGEWVTLDGGALRLRAYKCGTAHLEVHPDMAWRLNCVLANLYPLAIPPEFRQKPKKQTKSFVMMGRPLPFSVLAFLESMEKAYHLVANTGTDAWNSKFRREDIPNAMAFKGDSGSSPAREEAEKVLAYIGGVKVKNDHNGYYFQFDYNPRDAIKEIVCSGCLPDQKTHQYYPTPSNVAEAAIEMAQIGPHDICLEPSAGTGGLADLMPKDRTVCIEISALHCKVLEAKGHNAQCMDFLAVTKAMANPSRIVMNPPFSEGRWQAHLEHAAGLLTGDGRLVAILPASAKGKDVLPGWSCDWSQVFKNEFAGASVDVVVLAASRSGTDTRRRT